MDIGWNYWYEDGFVAMCRRMLFNKNGLFTTPWKRPKWITR
jgi:hypothetical protein